MDLTIEIVLPPRGATDFNASSHPKWRVLAIVAVYSLKMVKVVGMPRTGYIHVTGIPMPQAWVALTTGTVVRRLNERLTAPSPPGDAVVEKRIWCGLAASMTKKLRNDLLTDRQITVTWNQFKGAIRNMRDARNLTDADLA